MALALALALLSENSWCDGQGVPVVSRLVDVVW